MQDYKYPSTGVVLDNEGTFYYFCDYHDEELHYKVQFNYMIYRHNDSFYSGEDFYQKNGKLYFNEESIFDLVQVGDAKI